MKIRFLAFLILWFSFGGWAKTPVIYLNTVEPKDGYHVDLIKFLLKDNPYFSLEPNAGPITESRQEADIQSGALSIAAFASSKHMEDKFRPIRIPILKGLLGHRIFIIRKGEQSRFSQISRFSQLLQLKAGQGKLWSDTQILRDAGIKVVTTNKYDNLFYMLEGGRFDYFPRAVHEPFSEVASRQELGLEIEQDLMLIYPLPLYLFVSLDNKRLADEVTRRFEAAIADGSFDKFFFNHPLIKDVMNKTHIETRKVFRIDNPNLSPETPLDRKELWLDLTTIKK